LRRAGEEDVWQNEHEERAANRELHFARRLDADQKASMTAAMSSITAAPQNDDDEIACGCWSDAIRDRSARRDDRHPIEARRRREDDRAELEQPCQ